jgi:hypothetical protein
MDKPLIVQMTKPQIGTRKLKKERKLTNAKSQRTNTEYKKLKDGCQSYSSEVTGTANVHLG